VTKDTTAKVELAASSLAALREQLRLKLHLAGMDAGDLWKEEVRPQLRAIEGSLLAWVEAGLRSAGEARVQAQLGLMEARGAWDALEPRVSESLKRLQESSDEGDQAGVDASLRALLETAKDAIHAATEGLEEL
tara:strand:+ start:1583 stop:1984 length:402 start_codon:yes stop_codon:yes gene_type:complete